MPRTLRWFLLITAVVAGFYWKALFSNQFSMILGWEGTNQAYAWYSYAARAFQQGIVPAWDPYTDSGRNFVGETQTGIFYPLKLPLFLAPFDHEGFLSERLFHQMYVLAHLLAAFFMFLCARELGIRNHFAAFVAAICFTLGGFVGKVGWVHLLDSAIWLPLVFFFLLRALRAAAALRRLAYACCAGVSLGLAVLAGSIHVPLMNVMVIVSVAALLAFRPEPPAAATTLRSRLGASALVVFLVGVVSFLAGAAQLLPSMEFSTLARRWTLEWSGPFYERVPYFITGSYARLSPRSVFAFLLGQAETGGSEFSPYFGILPLLLTIIAVWRQWGNRWVRYLAVLGGLAFFYGLAEYSLLHGLAYVLIPYVDKSWEAGRFLYLTHFAMALLAGFGVQTLLAGEPESEAVLARIQRLLGWVVLGVLLAVGIPAILGRPELNDWPYVSFFFLLLSWALYCYMLRGHRQRRAQFLIVAVIVSDLYAFNFTFANRLHAERTNSDHLAEMKSLRPVAEFLRAQPGPFRVHFAEGFSPTSMGDVFAVQTTLGYGATKIDDYLSALWSPNGMCLFNVRYLLGAGEGRPEPPVFSSGTWKVYEQPAPCPRAWIAPRVVVESDAEVRRRIREEALDLMTEAYLSEAPATPLDASPNTTARITYGVYRPDRLEMDVEASSTALLVLSEVYHPGWLATINGQPATIYKVNNILRGVVVSPGHNRIVMEYRPASVRLGLRLSTMALLGTLLIASLAFLPKRKGETTNPPRSGPG